MRDVPFRLLLCGLWLGGAVAHAQAPADAGAGAERERERIARERAAVQALFAEREAACQSRFAVTDCVNDAKTQRREALAPLRRQAVALDDAQRKQRAAQRQEDVRSKVGSAQAREREVVVREAPVQARKPVAAPPAEAGSAPLRVVKQKPAPRLTTARTPPQPQPEAQRRAQEAAGQARIEARKQAAQAHREAVAQRNAKRSASGKRAAAPLSVPVPVPVPVPASAAVP
jgi:colicin import membrane protein